MASANDAVPAASSAPWWTPPVPGAPAVSTTPDGVWAVCPGDCPATLPGADVEPEPLAVEPLEPEPLEPEPLAVEPFPVEPVEPFAIELFPVEPFAVEPFAGEPLALEPLQLMVTRPLPPLMVPVLTPAVRVGVPVAPKKFWSDMPLSCGDALADAGP